MVAVLKEGAVPSKDKFFEDAMVVCAKRDEYDTEGCGAELSFKEADLKPRYWQASHSNKFYFVVVCPRCGHDCFINLPHMVFMEYLNNEEKMRGATFDGFSDRG